MSSSYLATADRLLRAKVHGAEGTWPRACAWLLRLELEVALDSFWQRVGPAIGRATHAQRPKLLMLTAYADRDVARRVDYLWWALTRAGHHHHYELGVTVAELITLRTELVDLRDRLAGSDEPDDR